MRKTTTKAILLLLTLLLCLAPVRIFAQQGEDFTGTDTTWKAALAIDLGTGLTVHEDNSTEKLYPASVTKIMTFLVALEEMGVPYDGTMPAENVTVGAEVSLAPYDSSKAYLTRGEIIRLDHLFYGLMLPSGNDAALTIAAYIGRRDLGGEAPNTWTADTQAIEHFVEMMNAKAASLGMNTTHFVNPHGYHDADHYTSAADISVMAQELMKYAFAKTVVSTEAMLYPSREAGADPQSVQIPEGEELERLIAANPMTSSGNIFTFQKIANGYRYWYNTNLLIQDDSEFYLQECTGVKTGSTTAAGACIVAFAETDGKSALAVLLGCEKGKNYADCNRLLRWTLDNTANVTYLPAGRIYASALVENSSVQGDVVDIRTAEELTVTMPKNRTDLLRYEIVWNEGLVGPDGTIRLTAPFDAGTPAGMLNCYLEDTLMGSVSLTVSRGAQAALPVKEETVREERVSVAVWVCAGAAVLFSVIVLLLCFRLRNRKDTSILPGAKETPDPHREAPAAQYMPHRQPQAAPMQQPRRQPMTPPVAQMPIDIQPAAHNPARMQAQVQSPAHAQQPAQMPVSPSDTGTRTIRLARPAAPQNNGAYPGNAPARAPHKETLPGNPNRRPRNQGDPRNSNGF